MVQPNLKIQGGIKLNKDLLDPLILSHSKPFYQTNAHQNNQLVSVNSPTRQIVPSCGSIDKAEKAMSPMTIKDSSQIKNQTFSPASKYLKLKIHNFEDQIDNLSSSRKMEAVEAQAANNTFYR